jgi:hypothetical protein
MKKIMTLIMAFTCLKTFALQPTDSDLFEKSASIANIEEILNQAEDKSSIVGRKILETSRIMISNQEIILGGCWDYVDAVYDRAGF